MAYIGKKPEDDLIKGNVNTYNAFTGDGSTTTFDVTNLLLTVVNLMLKFL